MRKIFICLSIFIMFACDAIENKEYTIAFYNVENLFDIYDDENINDEDFLPSGRKKWDEERYNLKLKHISKVLRAINVSNMPDIIGLCEIENRKVLEDLINQTEYENSFGIVHKESPDRRGIDCALLYNKNTFKVISEELIQIRLPWNDYFRTRDILHVVGSFIQGEKIHVYVNHWPSRREGKKITERRRVYVASQLKKNIIKVRNDDANAKIIVLGDFNDEPSNKAVDEELQAKAMNDDSEMNLFNLMYRYDTAGEGSYNYRGEWNMLDNIIVSGNLLDKSQAYYCDADAGEIFMQDWFIFQKRNGDKLPNRTYLGSRYLGGYSDHFPVYFKLKLK